MMMSVPLFVMVMVMILTVITTVSYAFVVPSSTSSLRPPFSSSSTLATDNIVPNRRIPRSSSRFFVRYSTTVQKQQDQQAQERRQSSGTEDMTTTAGESFDDDSSSSSNIVGTIVFLLPSMDDDCQLSSKFGIHSPVEPPSYLEVVSQLSNKAFWFSNGRTVSSCVRVPVIPDDNDEEDDDFTDNWIQQQRKLIDADIVIALGLKSPNDIAYATEIFEHRSNLSWNDRFHKCHFALDCGDDVNNSGDDDDTQQQQQQQQLQLPAMVGPYIADGRRWYPTSKLPWTNIASAKRFYEQMIGLFDRWTSDDFTVALMLFLNRFSGQSIDWVKDSADATWEKGPVRNVQEFVSMATKCGDCLQDCLKDETCKQCLETLTELDTRDQAASYRAIVSYESEQLEKFSFCVFQKHNIFQCDAQIPTIPKVEPMTQWRNTDLTQQTARSLLIGHLNDECAPDGSQHTDISWKVACGANVAYDQFPSQNQIFYEAAKGKDMWYDPVFRVQTLDGRNVWCKRHYRVRNGPRPGTFRLSVLDNGVTSNEFWTILGAADDLSWITFHYSGAASTVGQHYIGGLLCTVDGSLPQSSSVREEIWNIFKTAGIEPWELFVVNNDPNDPGLADAGPPPLDYYRKSVLEMKAQQSTYIGLINWC